MRSHSDSAMFVYIVSVYCLGNVIVSVDFHMESSLGNAKIKRKSDSVIRPLGPNFTFLATWDQSPLYKGTILSRPVSSQTKSEDPVSESRTRSLKKGHWMMRESIFFFTF